MLENVGGNVGPIKPLGPGPVPPGQTGPAEGERSFKEILQDSIDRVNKLQVEADQVLEKFTKGEASEDQVMVAFKKSQIAFETLMQMRNKLVDAFNEIKSMRI
jgi:flagellar hook-basal body complex protein FliE